MSYCQAGTRKKTTPQQGGKSHDKRGRRGHSWEKLLKDGTRIGRVCRNCGKKHLIPELRI